MTLLLATAQTLLDAYDRVGSDAAWAVALRARLNALASTPDGAALARIYAEIRELLAREMDGRTVVRTLGFASPAEEYRYELDRHDAHLLLRIFYSEALSEPPVHAAVDQAARHHLDAHLSALGGDYPGAIRTLEHSTGELITVLRGRGLDIPG